MDVYFISHGPPILVTDETIPARSFFKSWQEIVHKEKPSSILLITAHWETEIPTVSGCINQKYSTIYDFEIRPERLPLLELNYPAPSAPELAKRVKELLMESGFNQVEEDQTRGLDHAAWCPLMLMYPEANIPMCQLSLQTKLNGTHHYNMGKALSPLRDEGVLIIASGHAIHNVLAHGNHDDPVPHEDINRYEEKGPRAEMAHPSPEHLYPLHVALGAAGEDAGAELIHHSWWQAALSYACYRFKTIC
ncbi:hypothetical protein MKX03_015778 [Papaver bracteatum]|nr:hypothetical protein MKX03_015778 [Papaver bracteatum]